MTLYLFDFLRINAIHPIRVQSQLLFIVSWKLEEVHAHSIPHFDRARINEKEIEIETPPDDLLLKHRKAKKNSQEFVLHLI